MSGGGMDTRHHKRSKNGCLTCKARKKKCDESRPKCSECKRLLKECVWIEDNMTKEQILSLKRRVQIEEDGNKLRKRTAKRRGEDIEGHHSDENRNRQKIDTERDKRLAIGQRMIHEAGCQKEDVHKCGVHRKEQVSTKLGSFGNKPFTNQHCSCRRDHLRDAARFRHSRVISDASPSVPSAINHSDASPSVPSVINHSDASPSVPSVINHSDSLVRESSIHSDSQEVSSIHSGFDPPGASDLISKSLCPAFPEDSLLEDSLLVSPFNHSSESSDSDYSHLYGYQSIPPSPQVIPELLSYNSRYLYSYYVDFLSKKVCIAPGPESNYYQRVFLPLAGQDKGVLYSILAWAGFHLGGQWSVEGSRYMRQTLQHLCESLSAENTDRQSAVIKLATMLLICSAEICKGDVRNWSMILSSGWKLLNSHGGILKLNRSKEEHWLISNFAYHDLLSSSAGSRGTYFPPQDYDTIFRDHEGYTRGRLNPLLGICKTLYRLIGDVSVLVKEGRKHRDTREHTKHSYQTHTKEHSHTHPMDVVGSNESMGEIDGMSLEINGICDAMNMVHGTFDGDESNGARDPISLLTRANRLEKEIDSCVPEQADICGMSDADVELQLTLFEAFQLSAKLFLKQAVMRCNPSMLELQALNNHLNESLNVLVGTPVEASLVFPIFMCGIHCVTSAERRASMRRLDSFIQSYGPWNLIRAKDLIGEVWKRNQKGDTYVDWHGVLEELGWDINFA